MRRQCTRKRQQTAAAAKAATARGGPDGQEAWAEAEAEQRAAEAACRRARCIRRAARSSGARADKFCQENAMVESRSRWLNRVRKRELATNGALHSVRNCILGQAPRWRAQQRAWRGG